MSDYIKIAAQLSIKSIVKVDKEDKQPVEFEVTITDIPEEVVRQSFKSGFEIWTRQSIRSVGKGETLTHELLTSRVTKFNGQTVKYSDFLTMVAGNGQRGVRTVEVVATPEKVAATMSPEQLTAYIKQLQGLAKK